MEKDARQSEGFCEAGANRVCDNLARDVGYITGKF